MRYAVIDIGSNSLRLMAAECSGGAFEIIYKDRHVVRLGGELTVTGMLGDEAVKNALEVLAGYVKKAKELEANGIFAFATSAVRDAKNRQEFLSLCRTKLALEVDVLSGQSEALIGFCGALGQYGTGALIDIGGGSTELICGRGGDILLCASAPAGCVRALSKYCGEPDIMQKSGKWLGEVETSGFAGGRELPKKRFDRLLKMARHYELDVFAVGGTATTLASIAAGHTRTYDPRVVQGRSLTRGEIERVAGEIARMSPEQRKRLPALSGREDTILPGAGLLLKCMDELGAASVRTSDSDNLEGYLTARVLAKAGPEG